MKTLAGITILTALLCGGAAAGPIYQINFTGTITNGTASTLNTATNTLAAVQDLTGLTISGSMFFDLVAAPAPTVNVDGSGFTNTLIQSIGGPIFASEDVTINGLANPGAGFLPLPAQFNMAPIPSLPAGSTVTQNQDFQTLQFSAKPIVSPQSILSNMNFQYSWTDPQMSGSDIVALDLLISSGSPFFLFPPPGTIPSSFGPVTIGQNGVFTFALLTQNAGVADPARNFGVTTDYDVNGSFTFNSVSGALVAPEPGTLATVATALLGFVAIRWRKRNR